MSLSLAPPSLGIHPIVGMAWGALIGGLLQLLVQLPLLWRVGFRPQWVLDLRDAGLRRIAKLMLPAVVGLSATQINIFINTFYAASCAQGSVSWLNYAYRLFHLPMGLFGVALMVATMPVVSRHAVQPGPAALRDALQSSLALALLVTPAGGLRPDLPGRAHHRPHLPARPLHRLGHPADRGGPGPVRRGAAGLCRGEDHGAGLLRPERHPDPGGGLFPDGGRQSGVHQPDPGALAAPGHRPVHLAQHGPQLSCSWG